MIFRNTKFTVNLSNAKLQNVKIFLTSGEKLIIIITARTAIKFTFQNTIISAVMLIGYTFHA